MPEKADTHGQEAAPMPREITAELSGEAAAAGPPPVPDVRAPFAARLAEPGGDDLDRVHTWMNLDHVAEFFEQAWTRERWAENLRMQRAGTFSRPFIVSLEGTPVGYVELYRAARDVVARHYAAEPHDIGFHIAIGDPGGVGRGWGPRILEAFAAGVFTADPRCRRIVMEPDAANGAARRAADRAGLEFLGTADLPHKRAALLIRHRRDGDTCG